ncbi:MAG: sugar phosphate isomerase/epimerase family protein [Acidimicrobiales bacterium]
MQLKFGVDLITFYHPGFWGTTDRAEFEKRALEDPLKFWERTAESVAQSGVAGLELTFSPGDWETALVTFGNGSGLSNFLKSYGLEVISGFFSGFEYSDDLLDAGKQQKVIEQATRYAAYLAASGGPILVAGMPMRQRGTPDAPVFVDFDYVKAISDLVNRVGAATAGEGVRLALHPEVGSVFCVRRDINLFLALTDPSYVDFCPDTAHILLGGVSPVDVLQDHHERVVIAHWKDAVGRWPNDDLSNEARFELEANYFKRVGTGSVDWHGWIRTLDEARFSGWAILELDDAENPVEQVTEARQFVENLAAVTL